MTVIPKTKSFRLSIRDRILTLAVLAYLAWFVSIAVTVGTNESQAPSGFELIVGIVFGAACIGITFRLFADHSVIKVGVEGLSLNWLSEPIPWDEVQYGRTVSAQGFSFGMGWFELVLKTPMEMPPEVLEDYNADGLVDSLAISWRQATQPQPVWTLVTPTLLQISTGSLNVSANELAKYIEAYLPNPLSRT